MKNTYYLAVESKLVLTLICFNEHVWDPEVSESESVPLQSDIVCIMKKKAMKVGKKKKTVMKPTKVMKKQAAVKATKAMKNKAAMEPMKVIKKMASMKSVTSKRDKFCKLANKLLDKLFDAEHAINRLVNLGHDCQSTWASIQNCPQEVTASVKRMVTVVPIGMAEVMRDMEARLNQLTWTALPEE